MMTNKKSKLEIIPLLVNRYVNKNTILSIPNDIISLIIKFHGFYDISFDSNILIKTKNRIKFMELLYDNINKNDIKLKRMFSGKIDGFSSKIFHKKCDNISNTVSLI